MVKLNTFLLSCCCLLSIAVSAQTASTPTLVPVQVTIVDSYGAPLPGATVQVVGKAQGVIANEDGVVSIQVAMNDRIEFKYLGMKTRTMTVTKPLSGKIMLEDENAQLDQVVVTGYQRTTKKRVTGSVSTLTSDELKGAPTANLDMLMQGKVAGVNVQALSGRPGETAKIRIRGTNTISGNAAPLWVVDGVPLQRDIPTVSSNQIRNGDFNEIFTNGISGVNPNDIETVTVLKDASATAIYGSRAAGGVIVVTTKRGKEGKMSINYSTNLSMITTPSRNANLMNAAEKLAWEQELWNEFSAPRMAAGKQYPVIGAVGMIRSGFGKYAGWTTEQQDAEIQRLGQTSTDWFKEIFRNSLSQSHYLSLSGGGEKNTYYVSMGYSQNKGLLKRNDYDRYNVNTKLDLRPHSRVKLSFTADMAMQRSTSPSLTVDPFKYAYFANPYEKPYETDGSNGSNGNYAPDNTYYSLTQANRSTERLLPPGGYNILREINETDSESKNLSASLIANLSINLLDNLSFEGLASYGYVTNSTDNVNGKNTYAAWNDRPFDVLDSRSTRTYGSITQTSAYNTNYNLRGQLHFFDTFAGDHYLSALLGSEIRGQYSKSIYEKRYGYDPVSGNSSMPVYPQNTAMDYARLLSYATIMDNLAGQSIYEEAFASFYMSLDYVLKQRYILSLTARTDGSSNFGSKEQFNPTGSLGLSWNVDREPFMESLKSVLSSLSLRTAMGYTGNINKSVYPQLVMDYLNSFRKTDDESFRMGYLKNAPNPNLRWEKTRDLKFSVEMGFFDDRLMLQTELYDRRTSDAVTGVPVPYTTGFYEQAYNTSELQNRGIEFTLGAKVLKTKDWNLSLNANLAYNQNKLLSYNVTNPSLFNTHYVGYPLAPLISGRVKGIDPKMGIYTYEVRPDVLLSTAEDRNRSENYAFYLGTGTAPVNGGYSVSLSYKNLSLSMGGSYSLGGKIINNIESPAKYSVLSGTMSRVESIPTAENDLYANHLNVTRDRINRWSTDNPRTDGYPRLIDAYGEYLGLSNYMIINESITRASMLENVSYFKLNSLMLSYNFAGEWLKRSFVRSLALSFSMNNLFTITNYSGIDPETPGAVYPSPRTFSLGVSVGF